MSSVLVSRDIRYVELDGRVVLLDFRSQSYFVLDAVAGSMWLLAASGLRDDEAVAALEARYDAGSMRLQRDYAAFLGTCGEKGWLIDARRAEEKSSVSEPPAFRPFARRNSRWLTFGAWMSLFRVSRMLRKQGFSRAYRNVGSCCRAITTAPNETGVPLDRALRGFVTAENFFHLKRAPDDCLPRSLSLFVFLRSLGFPVEHRIGIQIVPFLAHGWVQLGDRVLLDHPGNPGRFTRIAGLPE